MWSKVRVSKRCNFTLKQEEILNLQENLRDGLFFRLSSDILNSGPNYSLKWGKYYCNAALGPGPIVGTPGHSVEVHSPH